MDVRGLVGCLFPHGTTDEIDIWIGIAVKSWRDVHNRYRDRLLAESQGKEENGDDACVDCKAVDPTLVSDESANVVCPAPQLMWNYMQATQNHYTNYTDKYIHIHYTKKTNAANNMNVQ